MPARLSAALLAALVLALTGASTATAEIPDAIPHVQYDGMQKQRYKFGPVKLIPGAN